MKAKLSFMTFEDILKLVFGNGEMEERCPENDMEQDQVERAVITSQAAKRLFSAHVLVAEELKELQKDHERLHEPTCTDSHNCPSYTQKEECLASYLPMLETLLYFAIYEEHPNTRGGGTFIVKNWKIASDLKCPWKDKVGPGPQGNILDSAVTRLSAIINGEQFELPSFTLPDDNVEGKVIGTLQDPLIRSIFIFRSAVDEEIIEFTKPAGTTDSSIEEWMELQVVGEVRKFVRRYEQYIGLQGCLKGIFETLICESMSAVANAKGPVFLGKDWSIIEGPPRNPKLSRRPATSSTLDALKAMLLNLRHKSGRQ